MFMSWNLYFAERFQNPLFGLQSGTSSGDFEAVRSMLQGLWSVPETVLAEVLLFAVSLCFQGFS